MNEYEKLGSESSFKVWPTNADRAMFRAVMTAGSRANLLSAQGWSATAELPRMAACYLYFVSRIEDYAERDGAVAEHVESRLLGLLQALRTGLQLVVIELEDDDDPQVIFETLNARGQPLLPSDLIRNSVFQQAAADVAHAAEPDYADDLYRRFWQPFDTDRIAIPVGGEERYWHVPERQGRLNRARIDLFIFHFLTMQTGSELAIGHIFQEFRTWREQSDDRLETFLEGLQRYAAIFRKLISPDGSDRASVLARRLRSLDTSTVYPFLLHLLGLPTSVLPLSDRDIILADVESWLIRRFVCQLTNKNYNKFFLMLMNKVRQLTTGDGAAAAGAGIVAEVRNELLRSTEDTARWPDDAEFKLGWLEKPLYVKSRPDRAVMVLSAIDAHMHTSKTERVALPEDLTVEHLLPQQGSIKDYPLPEVTVAGELPAVERSRLIHTVGNLTLLTQALNSSVSNGPFGGKRGAIAGHSALRLNARFQDPALSSWRESDIRNRGKELLDHASRVWSHPGQLG